MSGVGCETSYSEGCELCDADISDALRCAMDDADMPEALRVEEGVPNDPRGKG